MLKLLITRFWPALIPLILYLAWLAYARRKAEAKGEEKPGFTDGPWIWPVVLTLLLAIGGFLWLGLSATPEDGAYKPAHMENGQLVPAKVE